MVPLERAQALALSLVAPLGTETLPLHQARGRFVAEALAAPRPMPPCDNSAMDGWAVRAEETRSATRDRPVTLRVVGVIPAGAPPEVVVGPGQAARIFTGAMLPEGANAVLRQEAAEDSGGTVRAFAEVRPGEHVRRAGEELGEGQVGLAARVPLDPYALWVAAALGHAHVTVARVPKAAVITVGDELIRVGREALPHQVYDSNGVLIASLCATLGVEVAFQVHAADDDVTIRTALEEALDMADLVVTSGGASVGDRDRVKHVIRSMGGTLHVDGVAVKPGKPLGVAELGGKPVVVLPGNPGAMALGFDQIARPMLLRAQGVREVRRRVPCRLHAAQHKQAGLEYYLSATLEWDGRWPPLAHIRPQGAGYLVHSVGAHGWVILPRGRADFAAGEEQEIELFAFPRWE